MTPDKSLLVALDRFHNVAEHQHIRRWMTAKRDYEMARAIKEVGDTNVLRGRAQMMMEMVELFETAPQALDRLEKRQHGTKK